MSRLVYRVDVGRVVVTGVPPAQVARLDRAALATLVELAVARRLETAALPAGFSARLTVHATDRSVSTGGAPAIAAAVATQVALAATGGTRRG